SGAEVSLLLELPERVLALLLLIIGRVPVVVARLRELTLALAPGLRELGLLLALQGPELLVALLALGLEARLAARGLHLVAPGVVLADMVELVLRVDRRVLDLALRILDALGGRPLLGRGLGVRAAVLGRVGAAPPHERGRLRRGASGRRG